MPPITTMPFDRNVLEAASTAALVPCSVMVSLENRRQVGEPASKRPITTMLCTSSEMSASSNTNEDVEGMVILPNTAPAGTEHELMKTRVWSGKRHILA